MKYNCWIVEHVAVKRYKALTFQRQFFQKYSKFLFIFYPILLKKLKEDNTKTLIVLNYLYWPHPVGIQFMWGQKSIFWDMVSFIVF